MNHPPEHRFCPRRPPGGARRRRGGFTMMEILVAVGIILLLVGIAVTAMRFLVATPGRDVTTTALNNAQSLLTEYELYERVDKLNRLYMFWDETRNHYEAYPSPGDVTVGAAGRAPAAATVQRVMEQLVRIPKNQQIVGNLPAKQLMKDPPPPRPLEPPRPPVPTDPPNFPVLLDGWDNPIIFVPAKGLRVDTFGRMRGEQVVTSIGILPVIPNTNLRGPNLPPGARPFFASAGPDGLFDGFVDNSNPPNGQFDPDVDVANSDDNLYSFKQQ